MTSHWETGKAGRGCEGAKLPGRVSQKTRKVSVDAGLVSSPRLNASFYNTEKRLCRIRYAVSFCVDRRDATMKKTTRAVFSVLTALALSLAAAGAAIPAGTALAAPTAAAGGGGFDELVLAEIISDVARMLQSINPSPGIALVGGDWSSFAISRSGIDAGEDYRLNYYYNVITELEACGGILSTVKYSEYSRVALALMAIGAEPVNAGGYDLLEPLFDFDMTVYQGINGPIYAINALVAAGKGDLPVVDEYAGYILGKQLEDGGFAMSGLISDPDTTAMAIASLCSYLGRRGGEAGDEGMAGGEAGGEGMAGDSGYARSIPDAVIADAIQRAITRLSSLQRPTGGFTSYSSTNSESVSQTIIALCALSIPLSDERFVKEGNSLLDNLMTYYSPEKGFEHESGGGISVMATEQALCALVALWRMQTGRTPLFDMGDVSASAFEIRDYGLPGKHPDVAAPAAKEPSLALGEIAAQSGSLLTRSGYIAAVIDVLGLSGSETTPAFTDVPEDHPYYEAVRTAFAYGIVEGRDPETFDPDSLITVQEAAIVVYRLALLCGIGTGTAMSEDEAADILSQFDDYRAVSRWAYEGLAFCCNYGFIAGDAPELEPMKNISGYEAAEMLSKMLARARLAGKGADPA